MPKPVKAKRPPNAGSFKPGNRAGFIKRDATDEAPSIKGADGQYTAEALAKVTALAARDRAPATIARALGLTAKQFAAELRTDEALADAMEVGTAQARDYYVDRLRELGKKSFVPSIYLGKALHAMSDAPAESNDNRVSVQVVLPGAQQAGKLIEGDVISDDSNEDDGVPTVAPTPLEAPVRLNGAHPLPPQRGPEPMQADAEPKRRQTSQERQACRDWENKTGIRSIDLTRADFKSDAAFARWQKQR